MVCSYDGALYSNSKEQTTTTRNNMEDLTSLTLNNKKKPGTEEHILYIAVDRKFKTRPNYSVVVEVRVVITFRESRD